ncbi:tetratricopeptide repeat protein, partial [Paraglaciecola hydrolytica]|uniref:tetratricopeptide repeat protein n=1 Tax=Paraglaciecola hydrolytica TaxID=1799789 RepID=UPI0019110FDD
MNTTRLVNQGLNLLFQGQLENASAISQQLLLAPSPDAASYFLACEISIAKNNVEQALEYILLATQQCPSEPQLQLRKAEVQLMLRQGINAQKTAKTLAEFHTSDPAIQLSAAVIFAQCDNHQGAETFLLNARAKKYKNQRFLFELARNQFYLGKVKNSQKIIKEYLSLYPDNDGTIYLLLAQLNKQSASNNHIEQLR